MRRALVPAVLYCLPAVSANDLAVCASRHEAADRIRPLVVVDVAVEVDVHLVLIEDRLPVARSVVSDPWRDEHEDDGWW
jgi:hypothetical protein